MIETRTYWVREHLLPALVTGDVSGHDDRDDRELAAAYDDLEGLDGGGWSVTAEVHSSDEFRRPDTGGVHGRCANVVISREVTAPAHVFVGYMVGDEYVSGDVDGRVCATEEEIQRYITERQRAETGERRAEMAGDLYYGLRECLESVKDTLRGEPWTQGDLQGLIDEHVAVEKAYRTTMTSFMWVFATDGGAS